ncbi:hypothetical protein U062_01455 [Gammaproteobacteria bacterium MOLA455]|nr:hypothetical protein U062_01455 [Gammaproteobacteria bacterium MOLA455]
MVAVAIAVKGTADRHGILKGTVKTGLKDGVSKSLLKVSSFSPDIKHHSSKISFHLLAAAFCSTLVSKRFIDLLL